MIEKLKSEISVNSEYGVLKIVEMYLQMQHFVFGRN